MDPNFLCDICGKEYPRHQELHHRLKHEVERENREYLNEQTQLIRLQLGQLETPHHDQLQEVPCPVHSAGQAHQQQPHLVSVQSPSLLQQSSQQPTHADLMMSFQQLQLREQGLFETVEEQLQPIATREQQRRALIQQLMHHVAGQPMGPQPVQPSVLVTEQQQQQEEPENSHVPGMDSASAAQLESQATLPPPGLQLFNSHELYNAVRYILGFSEFEPETDEFPQ